MTPVGAPAVVGAHEDEPVLVGEGGARAHRVHDHPDVRVGQRDRVPVLGADGRVPVAGLVGVAEVDEHRVGVGLAQVPRRAGRDLAIGLSPAQVVAVDHLPHVDRIREYGAGVVLHLREGDPVELGQGDPVERREGGQFGVRRLGPRQERGIGRVVASREVVVGDAVLLGPHAREHRGPGRAADRRVGGAGLVGVPAGRRQRVDVRRGHLGEHIGPHPVDPDQENLGRCRDWPAPAGKLPAAAGGTQE